MAKKTIEKTEEEVVLTREQLEVVELRELVAKLQSLGLKSIADLETRIAILTKWVHPHQMESKPS